MSNIIFLSSTSEVTIENLKLTTQLTARDLNLSEWVFRLIIKVPNIEKIKKKGFSLYLLLKLDRGDKIKIGKIVGKEQHNLLKDRQYLEYLGRSLEPTENVHILRLHEEYEFKFLRNEEVILPNQIEVRTEDPKNFSFHTGTLRSSLNIDKNDIGVKIDIPKQQIEGNAIYVIQFALVLEGFIPQDVIKVMNEPGSGWSFGINIHYTPEHSKLFSEISQWLCQIKSLELWIGIPHRHLILDSSPRYKALYSLSHWDTDQFKAFERVHEALQRTKEFSHVPGDIWVKIIENSYDFLEKKENNGKIEEKFSLIGYSPWIGSEFQDIANKVEEKAKDLVMKNEMEEEIHQINNKIDIQESNNEKTYISYKDAITSWGLFATMLTLVLTILMIFIRDLTGAPIEIPGEKFLTLKEVILLGVIAGSAMIVIYHIGVFILKRFGIIKKKYFDNYK